MTLQARVRIAFTLTLLFGLNWTYVTSKFVSKFAEDRSISSQATTHKTQQEVSAVRLFPRNRLVPNVAER